MRSIVLLALLIPCILALGAPDPGQKTRHGCTCKSECGATIDFDNAKYDWCYTAEEKCGTYSITRLAYYDYCVYPANPKYENQTAAAKQEYLWKQVVANQSSETYPNIAPIFAESMKTSFDDVSDTFPAGRIKYIHSVGYVCQFAYAAAPSEYTGIFRSGAKHGLLRFSAAKPLVSSPPNIVPGFGIKFLRSNVPSANFLAMPSLDGQASFNFFEKNFTNHPAYPDGEALRILAKKFAQASHCPLQVGLSDTASFDESGVHATSIKFPYQVDFVPTHKVSFPTAPYNQSMLAHYMAGIAVNTTLFELYGHASPNNRQNHVAPVHLGSIRTTSQCVPSHFGDTKLFFRHVYMEDDFKLRPDWLKQINVQRDCGTDQVGPTPPVLEA